MERRLNLGCGEFYKEGHVNLDNSDRVKADVKHDLNILPYPFADASFDHVLASHVLEHIDRPFVVMAELHRILRPGGTLIVKVPHFSRGFTHAEHKAGFDVTFPYYFRKGFLGGYQGFEFRALSVKLHWFAQPELKRTVLAPPVFWAARGMGAFFTFFANLSPFLCSRFWCFWVGGFEEIEFHFQRP